jgi:Zn-dependent M28 family amino/carboxypeptidase
MRKLIILSILLFISQGCSAQYSYDAEKLVQDVKFLSSDAMQGRKTGTPGNKMAREFIIGQLKEMGVVPFVPDFIQTFRLTENVTGHNILGVIEGKRKETIVISAHYDHVGVNHNEIYNGADDNASGVAALLAMASHFKKNKPTHRIVFAFFDAEESGLKGSAHFVNTINLQEEKIILNINLDMVSRNDKNTLYACGGYHSPHVKKILETVSTPKGFTLGFGYDDPILKRNDWTSQSDHYNFHLKKIPFVYFGVEDHADYHRPTDDFEKINLTFYRNSVEVILQCVKAVDKQLD